MLLSFCLMLGNHLIRAEWLLSKTSDRRCAALALISCRVQRMSAGSPLKQHAQQQQLQAHRDEMQCGEQQLLSVQHLHLLLRLTPMELLQLSIVVSWAPPPVL